MAGERGLDDADGKRGWANPAFDDSKWQLLHSDESLAQYISLAAQRNEIVSALAGYGIARFNSPVRVSGGRLCACFALRLPQSRIRPRRRRSGG